jgi:hypothetical protein
MVKILLVAKVVEIFLLPHQAEQQVVGLKEELRQMKSLYEERFASLQQQNRTLQTVRVYCYVTHILGHIGLEGKVSSLGSSFQRASREN